MSDDATRPKVGDKFAILHRWHGPSPATVTKVTPAGFIELDKSVGFWVSRNGYWERRGASGWDTPIANPWSDDIEASYQEHRRKVRATNAIEAMRAESIRSRLTEPEVAALETILAAAQARAHT
jgi:hypothetical protein